MSQAASFLEKASVDCCARLICLLGGCQIGWMRMLGMFNKRYTVWEINIYVLFFKTPDLKILFYINYGLH